MKCESCGAEFPDGAFVCDNCGSQVSVDYKKKISSIGWGCQLVCWLFVAGILFAYASPSFLRDPDKARYTRCLEAAAGIKVAEEMYISDHGTYTTDVDRLGIYMIKDCNDPTGKSKECNGKVYNRVRNNCLRKADWVLTAGEYNDLTRYYQIRATARDRYACKICITPDNYLPSSFMDCPASEMKCPPPPENKKGSGKLMEEHSDE